MSWFAGKSRLVVAAAGVLLAAIYVAAATQLRMPAFSDPVGPRMVPYLIAAGLILSCIALAIEHMVDRARKAAPASDPGDGLTGVALVALGLLVGYYLLFDALGFIVSTGVFLFAFLSYTNRRRWLLNLSIAAGVPVAMYLLLATLLGARLPAGILAVG
jgi:putative tricarboxylic transport membrane protein